VKCRNGTFGVKSPNLAHFPITGTSRRNRAIPDICEVSGGLGRTGRTGQSRHFPSKGTNRTKGSKRAESGLFRTYGA
jgi:hypothetical protein